MPTPPLVAPPQVLVLDEADRILDMVRPALAGCMRSAFMSFDHILGLMKFGPLVGWRSAVDWTRVAQHWPLGPRWCLVALSIGRSGCAGAV